MKVSRRKTRGVQIVQFIGLMLVTLMLAALAIDFGFYFTAQNHLQTTADAAALAAADALYRSEVADVNDRLEEATLAAQDLVDENMTDHLLEEGDVVFGFIDPETREYDPDNFTTPTEDSRYDTTGGYNAVWVAIRRTDESINGRLPTILARLFGVEDMETQAYSVALIDSNIGTVTEGLRPIYVCQGLYDMAAADGNPTNDVIEIYGDEVTINGTPVAYDCDGKSPGNWGIADLRDCETGAPGNLVAGWLMNGFNSPLNADTPEDGYDPINVGECRSTKPGNNITSKANEDALQYLIDNQVNTIIPLYDDWSDGGGSTAEVYISGFTGFVFTDYIKDGSERAIVGRFTRAVCSSNCVGSTGEDTSGGGLVKVRLASRETAE